MDGEVVLTTVSTGRPASCEEEARAVLLNEIDHVLWRVGYFKRILIYKTHDGINIQSDSPWREHIQTPTVYVHITH